jgi:hypothetical protein
VNKAASPRHVASFLMAVTSVVWTMSSAALSSSSRAREPEKPLKVGVKEQLERVFVGREHASNEGLVIHRAMRLHR